MNIFYFLPKTFHEHCISFSYKDTHIFTIFHSPASYFPFWWIGFFLWPVTFLNLFLLCRPEQWYHAKDCHCLSCGHFCPSSHVFLPILYGLLDSWIWSFPPLSSPAGSCRSTLKTFWEIRHCYESFSPCPALRRVLSLLSQNLYWNKHTFCFLPFSF